MTPDPRRETLREAMDGLWLSEADTGFAVALDDVLARLDKAGLTATRPGSVAVPVKLLRAFVDNNPCQFDHDGGCQAHGNLSIGPGQKCPQQEAKDVLAEYGRTEPAEGDHR